MKKLLFLLIALLPLIASAQSGQSVVTLKNGTELKGTIKAIDPTDALTIVIAGIETTIKMTDVAKVEEGKEIVTEAPSSQHNINQDEAVNNRTKTSESFVAISEGKRFCFNVLSKVDKTVEIIYNKNVKYTDSYCRIPSSVEYNGDTYIIVAIGENAFNENKKIETLELPSTIKKIGAKAFEQCKHLTKIIFSPGLEIIDEKAFSQCKDLPELELPSGLTEIRGNAFLFNTKLERVIFPNTLKSVGIGSFAYCLKLTEISMQSGLERIEDMAFYSTKIEKIDIPNTVNFIGTRAFLSGTSFIGQESIIKWISIPESVKEIGKQAFCKFRNMIGNSLPSKCHIDLLPSWIDCEEAERIGLSEESFNNYINSK